MRALIISLVILLYAPTAVANETSLVREWSAKVYSQLTEIIGDPENPIEAKNSGGIFQEEVMVEVRTDGKILDVRYPQSSFGPLEVGVKERIMAANLPAAPSGTKENSYKFVVPLNAVWMR